MNKKFIIEQLIPKLLDLAQYAAWVFLGVTLIAMLAAK